MQPVKDGTVVDNFRSAIVKEPLDSDWDTTPAASMIKFFGGMVDEDRRRRGHYGDENEEEQVLEHKELEQELDQTEVTFGFPILDSTRDSPMKNIPPSALPHFHGMSSEDLTLSYLNSTFYAAITIMLGMGKN